MTRLSTRRIVFPATSAWEWLSNRTAGAPRHLPQDVAVAATQVAPPQRRARPRKAPAIEASDERGRGRPAPSARSCRWIAASQTTGQDEVQGIMTAALTPVRSTKPDNDA